MEHFLGITARKAKNGEIFRKLPTKNTTKLENSSNRYENSSNRYENSSNRYGLLKILS